MRFTGTIVEWNEERGFGFIEPAAGGSGDRKRTFFHIKAYRTLTAIPSVGRGETARASPPRHGLAKFGAFVFIGAVIVLVVVGRVPWYVPVWYVLISFVTAIAYAIDKGSAERRRWRTTESTLQWMALIGGWPGAWIAQQDLRHKTRKASFQSLFRGLVVINVAVLAWFAAVHLPPPFM